MSDFNERETGLIYYGPHACGECCKDAAVPTAVLIARVSQEQGGAEFDYPEGPIYPNTAWVPHVHRV